MRTIRSCLSPIPESFSPTTTPHPPNPKNMKKNNNYDGLGTWIESLISSKAFRSSIVVCFAPLMYHSHIESSPSLVRPMNHLSFCWAFWRLAFSVCTFSSFFCFLFYNASRWMGCWAAFSRRSCLRAPGVLVTRICILKTITVVFNSKLSFCLYCILD